MQHNANAEKTKPLNSSKAKNEKIMYNFENTCFFLRACEFKKKTNKCAELYMYCDFVGSDPHS